MKNNKMDSPLAQLTKGEMEKTRFIKSEMKRELLPGIARK